MQTKNHGWFDAGPFNQKPSIKTTPAQCPAAATGFIKLILGLCAMQELPSRQATPNQRWPNVGSPSTTLDQRHTKIDSTCRVRRAKIKWNESGFRPPLCTYRLNWARRTSWGWWDDWDDTVLQTQDSKFEPWWSEAEHATSRSRVSAGHHIWKYREQIPRQNSDYDPKRFHCWATV